MKPKRLVVVRFRRDRERWEVDHVNPRGSPFRRTRRLFGSEEEALKYAAEIAPRLDAVAPPVKDQTMTLGAAFELYFEAKARKKSVQEDRRVAAHLLAAFGGGTRLRDITASKIASYKAHLLAAGSVRRKNADGTHAPLGAASINRPLGVLRHLLRMAAQDWEALAKVPTIRLEREPQGKIRWLEPDEEARLLGACAKSQNRHLLAIVTVALETGFRKGELLGLTWDRVDMARGIIRLEVTKSGKRREVPMRDKVYAVLAAMPKPREGRVWPNLYIRTAFENAVENAKIEDFTLHSCRHHFASWFMMRGGSLLSLNRILGHATLAMTMRYAHLSPDHLRGEMAKTERRATLEPNAGTSEAQESLDRAEVSEITRASGGSGTRVLFVDKEEDVPLKDHDVEKRILDAIGGSL
jgi:integrase